MVYDRRFPDRELHFEASGALMGASLVMRDLESDSWWSIMTSTAIGGPLEGSELRELPFGRKTTWGEWRRAHPDTLVLSVDGVEHVERDPYTDYFGSEETFRRIEVDDRRLAPKTPIFGAWIDGRPVAVPHAAFEGGAVVAIDHDRTLLLHRDPGAPLFASSRAFVIGGGVDGDARRLLEAVDEGAIDAAPAEGLDTYWYTWVIAQPETAVLP